MKILRWLAIVFGIALVCLLVVAILARLGDGPYMAFAGGAFTTGKVVNDADVDWSFLKDRETIDFELLDPPRSRTVWILYEDGDIFIPCGIPWFLVWKQWPHEALEDGRAVLRIDGRRYHGRLVKVENPSLHGTLAGMVAAKYGVASDFDADTLWLFRFES